MEKQNEQNEICRNGSENGRPAETAVFMNMCMVCDGENVLALDKVSESYSGTTFPGGHVEPGETFAEAVIREIKEETGLLIRDPVLKGIYHWYRDGLHQVGLLYRASSFSGELQSSDEGRVYWISRKEFEKKPLALGMLNVLKIMEQEAFTECFMDVKQDGTIEEHLY